MKYSKKHDESALVPTVARGAARLLLFAAALALLGGLVLTSTAQATVRVKNTSNGDVHGYQRGVRAYVDASYFQGVPYGYTPAMAIRMNNSWGANRSLELKMTFTSPAYGPYRNVRVVLTRDGSTLCNYAIADPNPLRIHYMEIFETYETSTDGYWDAYFDHACLTDGDPVAGPVKWYLHDHGTTSETKVTCPGYPQGEWAHFYDIQILDRYWYWTYQLAPYWPVTVVDDNPYFDLHWVLPNDHWLVRTTSRADDDSAWEVSTWAQDWQWDPGLQGISPYLDNGFRAGFLPTTFDTYVYDEYEPGYWPVHEWDLRDWYKIVGGTHGLAEYGLDKYDFSLWASHGNTDVLGLDPPAEASTLFWEDNGRWGKHDLEWAYVFACEFTEWEDDAQMTHDYGLMAGLHALCGFRTEFACPNPDLEHPAQGADYQYGQYLVQCLTGTLPGNDTRYSIVEAFEKTARDKQSAGHCTRCFFTPTTLYDHLPNYGSFAIEDPVGWYQGGLTYCRVWWT